MTTAAEFRALRQRLALTGEALARQPAHRATPELSTLEP
jgi:hypothetical protein